MADESLDVYLNDHLAGAMLGSDLAEQLHTSNEGTPLGEEMGSLAKEIEQDRQHLIDLMEQVGATRNPVKQATTWMAEKASRAKFSGATSGDSELGRFMALESLMLGVSGKLALWRMLAEVRDRYDALRALDLEGLIAQVEAQRDVLERARIVAGREAFTPAPSS